jgi:hypothetical protein
MHNERCSWEHFPSFGRRCQRATFSAMAVGSGYPSKVTFKVNEDAQNTQYFAPSPRMYALCSRAMSSLTWTPANSHRT